MPAPGPTLLAALLLAKAAGDDHAAREVCSLAGDAEHLDAMLEQVGAGDTPDADAPPDEPAAE